MCIPKLSQENALDYGCFKTTLLQRCNYEEQGYRQHFKEVKPDGSEKTDQFIARLKNYFTQWLQLSEMENTLKSAVDFMLKQQFINFCFKQLSVYLIERKAQSLREFGATAEQHLTTQNKKLAGYDFNTMKNEVLMLQD